jgi:hypothetical protein
MDNLSFTSCTGFVKVTQVIYDRNKNMFVNRNVLIINKNHIVSFEKLPEIHKNTPLAKEITGPVFCLNTTETLGLKVTSQELTDLYRASGEEV